MYGLGSYELFSFNDTPDLPAIPAVMPPVAQLTATKISTVKDKINPIATENLQKNPLKRKRQDEPRLKSRKHTKLEEPQLKSRKRTQLEDLNERIKKFQNLEAEKLTDAQKDEILGKATSLVNKYYNGPHPDQVHQFISEISNQAHKIGLLVWIKCVKKKKILHKTLEMLSKYPSKFDERIRNYILITNELPNKLKSLSSYVTKCLNDKTPREYYPWHTIEDGKIHKAHVKEHDITRKEIQKKIENANQDQKNVILNTHLDSIIKMSYSKLMTKKHYSLNEIKNMISKRSNIARSHLLEWLLYYTNIDTVRLLNLLTEYNLPLDESIVDSLKKLIKTADRAQISLLRRKLKERENNAIRNSRSPPSLPPIPDPAFHAPLYPYHTILSPFPGSFYPHNYFPQLPSPTQQQQFNGIPH